VNAKVLRFRIQDSGFRIQDFRVKVQGPGCRPQGVGLRGQDRRLRFRGSKCREPTLGARATTSTNRIETGARIENESPLSSAASVPVKRRRLRGTPSVAVERLGLGGSRCAWWPSLVSHARGSRQTALRGDADVHAVRFEER